MYKERTISAAIKRASGKFKAVLLTGPRQAGKTTCMKEISSQGRKYITFDDPLEMAFAHDQPKIFFENNRPPLLIDEAQYVPELFRHIKKVLDGSRETGQIWLTGSQQSSLMKKAAESLAGRIAIFSINGFSIYERFGKGAAQKPFLPSKKASSVLDILDSHSTFRIIWQGSYPGICEMPDAGYEDWRLFYSSYTQTYLERDVPWIANVSDRLSFIQFLRIAASRTGQELNLSDIARLLGITSVTAKAWLSILQASGIVYLLQPYFRNISKRISKKPKLYFADTGLCCYLMGLNSPEMVYGTPFSGQLFETFAVMEILKSHWHNGRSPECFYYRDSAQAEIDLVISENGRLHPIEIKQTGSPVKDDARHFSVLESLGEQTGCGSVVCLTDKPRALADKANAISIWNI